MSKPYSFADRLKQVMVDRNLTKSELAKTCGIDKANVTRYCRGDYEARQDVIYKMATALNIDAAWLMGYDVPMQKTDEIPGVFPMPDLRRVPRVGRIACGEPVLAQDNLEGFDDVPSYIHCEFTLVCKGDSMINARIFDGDLVCISTQLEVHNGDIAAVLVDEEDATLKRVRLFPDHIVLEPENPRYRPMVFWEEDMERVRIIGKATHFISTVW